MLDEKGYQQHLKEKKALRPNHCLEIGLILGVITRVAQGSTNLAVGMLLIVVIIWLWPRVIGLLPVIWQKVRRDIAEVDPERDM